MSKNTVISEIANVSGLVKQVGTSGFSTAIPNVDYQLPISLYNLGNELLQT